MLSVFLKRLAFLLILISLSVSAQNTKIFWVDYKLDYGKIQSADIDGNNVQDILTEKNEPCGLVIDWQSDPQKMYFGERGASKIVRANLDGSGLEDVVTGISGIFDIEIDPVNRKIYWVRDYGNDDAVQRADMDDLNSQIEDLYTSTSESYEFYGIGLDLKNEKVYWTQANTSCNDKIRRMNFNKTGLENIIVSPQTSLIYPWDIDVVGNNIYWTDSGVGKKIIFKANLDGTQIDTVLQEVECQYFTVDTIAGKIYFAESHKIGFANLDGSGRTELITGLGTILRGINLAHNVPTTISDEYIVTSNFTLHQNYPNPFNPTTTISYQLPSISQVDLGIYNLLGQKVATLVSKMQSAGSFKVEWDASGFSSGVYFYHLETDKGFVQSRKLILLK